MDSLLFLLPTLAVLGILIWILLSRKQEQQHSTRQVAQLQQQLQQTTELVLEQLNRQQNAHNQTSHTFHSRLDHATKVVNEVQGKLLQLEVANKQMYELGKDISSLQKILQAPKMRGNLGEIWLAELISQIFPASQYKLQYAFRSGETCDAVVFLRDNMLLPIDAKFSLENFTRMIEAEEEQKLPYQKLFASDVKRRIDEISKKYIQPQEGTLEIAFMYVPAENVYYHAFIQDREQLNLLDYAYSKKVIPVSPSSFYSYLQVILFGLRGLEIEKSAKEIQKNLSGLETELGKFHDIYSKIGTHLRHAQQSFEVADKRLDRVEQRFMQITTAEQPLLDAIAEHAADPDTN